MTDDRLRIILSYSFGFACLTFDFVLAVLIAIGKVYAESSYGLLIVLNTLGMLGAGFVGYEFGYKNGKVGNDNA